MSCVREQSATRQKSPLTEAADEPSKLQILHSRAFYDSISQVWLTRRALRDLDRRASQYNFPYPPASTGRYIYPEDTRREIKRFARGGGPDLRDIRGYPPPTNLTHTMSPYDSFQSNQTKSNIPTNTSPKTKKSSAYDKNFEQHLIENKVYPIGYDYPDGRDTPEPGTVHSLFERLARPRASLSLSNFTKADFQAFGRKNERVIDEGEVMRDIVPIIAGNSNIPSKQNLLFAQLNPITNAIVTAKPDFYDGARLGDVDKKVRDDLGKFIIPTGYSATPVAPNFFLEVKGPSGFADVAKRQACYNGALGARGLHQLQSYHQDKPIYDDNAYTITSTYHDGQLKMYTTHPTQSADGTTEYHMSLVNTWGLTGNPNTFREGATAFRNARDWAQEQRDAIILATNDRAGGTLAQTSAPSQRTELQDTPDSARYDMSQPALEDREVGYLHTEPAFESSALDDRSEEKDTYLPAEPEILPDEPSSNKRGHQPSGKTASKFRRYDARRIRRRRK